MREAASLPASSALGLKRSQAQQGQPVRMTCIRPVRATVQVDRLRLVGGLRVHALARAATSSASASTSTALGSKVSP